MAKAPQRMFYIDAVDADELAIKMDEAAVAITRDLMPMMLKIGEMWVESAKEIASSNGSASIPGTIKFAAVPEGVEVRAGGGGNEIAALWERGNKGSKRSAKTFRHPVYRTDVNPDTWVEQEKHPYLQPALRRTAAERRALMQEAWTAALTEYRMEPEWTGPIGEGSI